MLYYVSFLITLYCLVIFIYIYLSLRAACPATWTTLMPTITATTRLASSHHSQQPGLRLAAQSSHDHQISLALRGSEAVFPVSSQAISMLDEPLPCLDFHWWL